MKISSRSWKIAGATAFAVVAGTVFAAWHIVSMLPDPNAPLTVHKLRENAYWVSGGISNTGFIVGDKGVVVIDAQMFQAAAKQVLSDIAKITRKSVDAMILTHSDPDHINGLPAYPAGIQVVAQENCKREMIEALNSWSIGFAAPPAGLKNYLPTRTVGTSADVVIDGLRMHLFHIAPAHTDGDLLIYLPDQKLVYAGDILTPEIGLYPGIHINKHGSSLGWIETVRAMLTLDADTFVSGHGELLSRSQIIERLQIAIRRRAEIEALVERHKSLDEIKVELHDRPLPGVASRFPTFIETTYEELTTHTT
jgi:glyoxylase-like metal-dependent hydrolase (beta-lactamase superfamily II)